MMDELIDMIPDDIDGGAMAGIVAQANEINRELDRRIALEDESEPAVSSFAKRFATDWLFPANEKVKA